MRFLGSMLSGLVAVAAVFVLSECSAPAAPSCIPGQTIACAGIGCTGSQSCSSDGKSYGECLCGAPPFPATGPNSGLLGAACASVANCRKGFDCITSESKLINGEGPSGGICLAQCLPSHDFCKGIDATSKCVLFYDGGTPAEPADDLAYCLPGCKLGAQPSEADKCRGRADLVCSETVGGSGAGVCLPACRSNIDCGGRFCHLKTGLCGDAAPVGDPIGTACDPSALTCAGACIPHGGLYAECSGVCTFGTPGCGQTNVHLPLDYYCYLDPTGHSGDGDLGNCARACDCNKDCGRPDAVCEPRPSLAAKTGRAGVCGAATFPTGGARPKTPC